MQLVRPNPIKSDAIKIKHLGYILSRLWEINMCKTYLYGADSNTNFDPISFFLKSICIQAYLIHIRIIDEFFWQPKFIEIMAEKDKILCSEKKRNPKYKPDDFFAIHCLTEDEYNELYQKLISEKYILDDSERKLINKKFFHTTYSEKTFKTNLFDYNFAERIFSAFKEFLKYPTPKTLIKKNPLWTDKYYKEVIELLK